MLPLSPIEKDILKFMADTHEKEGIKPIPKTLIFKAVNTSDPNYVLSPLFERDLIKQEYGQSIKLTEKGYNIVRGVVEGGNTSINFNGSIHGAGIAFDNSTATVNNSSGLDLLLKLSDRIENHPELSPDQKSDLLGTIQDLAKHPLVAGILSSLLGASLV